MKRVLILFLLFVSFAFPAFAEDTEGSKDHPIVTRMPNYYIQEYKNNFDAFDFFIGPEKSVKKEGNATFIFYHFDSENVQSPMPSKLQIVRNYENALKKLGAKEIYSGSERVTFKLNKGNQEIWLMLGDFDDFSGNNNIGMYSLRVVEIEAMKQEVTASEMLEAINKDGFIALYINFDTGKSDIKAESQPAIDEIVQMLKNNPELKISIEGHTDNVGNASSNKTLSENRAKAVMKAIISKGISDSKLSSVGWGQEKPVADNRTEDGKSKNRRVEIVKK